MATVVCDCLQSWLTFTVPFVVLTLPLLPLRDNEDSDELAFFDDALLHATNSAACNAVSPPVWLALVYP